MERTTDGAHQFRIAASENFFSRQLLKGTHHRIIPHRTSLNNRILPQLTCIFEAQDFIQAVLYHRIRKSRRNVRYGSSLAHRLFYLRVHKYRAACAQVIRMCCPASLLAKLLHRITQRPGKSFEERAATGRTGFIDFNAVDNAAAHEHRLHVLSADIENERYVFL